MCPGFVEPESDVALKRGGEEEMASGVLRAEKRRCKIEVAVGRKDLEIRIVRHRLSQIGRDVENLLVLTVFEIPALAVAVDQSVDIRTIEQRRAILQHVAQIV